MFFVKRLVGESKIMLMQHLKLDDVMNMERRKRATLINYLSGFKSANLIGTKNSTGQLNVAVFNSVVHIGANPPYFGFILRPVNVPRHTYQYINETGYYTINHIHKSFYQAAHQTSAKYDTDVSEFEAVGITPEFRGDFFAPYVAESHIQMGLELKEIHRIECNGTFLIIGKILEIWLPDNSVTMDGHIDLSQQGTVAIGGLDTYYEAHKLNRLEYARLQKNA